MSNRDDEELMAIPNYSCPSCRSLMNISSNQFDKFSPSQANEARHGRDACADVNLVVVSCSNYRCTQYNKFKVVRLPRVKCPTAEVDLGG